MHDVTVWRPFVCPVGILTVTHQRAACNAASVHFSLTVYPGHINENKDQIFWGFPSGYTVGNILGTFSHHPPLLITMAFIIALSALRSLYANCNICS